jgi:membrane protease YdiL (CAAX protease family)
MLHFEKMDTLSPLVLSLLVDFAPVAIILIILAFVRQSSLPIIAGLLLFGVFSLDFGLLYLPKILNLKSFTWNWEGKFLSFLWPWIFMYGVGWPKPADVGIFLPKSKMAWIEGTLMGLLFAFIGIVLGFWFGELPTQLEKETLLYQATMPGLSEELVYRGVFLAILNRYLGATFKFSNVKYGWGLILVSVLFVMAHAVVYDTTLHSFILIEAVEILLITFIALALGYIRIKYDSIWPAVLCHNIINFTSITGAYLTFSIR